MNTHIKPTTSASHTINENFKFGDIRLNKRGNVLLEQLSKQAGQTLPQALNGEPEYEGAIRFFGNERITPEKILHPHFEEIAGRCQGFDLVAVLQDSSELDYDYLGIEEFGSMQSNIDHGYRIHPSLVVTEEGTPLGLLAYMGYTRETKEKSDNKKKHRNSLPIEEKESFRWLQGYRNACGLSKKIGKDTLVVSICDREGDIFEIFSEAEDALSSDKAHALIRAQHNRTLDKENDASLNRLNAKLAHSPILDQGEVTVSKGLPEERSVKVNIRATAVSLKAPATANKKNKASVSINVVQVSEVNPPEGKTGLYWLLLTTLPIDSVEDVRRIVKLYSKRWQIEVYFKVLKSGCGILRTRLQSRKKIESFIAFMLLVSWRLMLSTYLAREFPDESCTVVFTDVEWKLAYFQVNKNVESLPDKIPTIREMIKLVATLGGYKKRQDPPGIITVWRGISKLFDMTRGYNLAAKMERAQQRKN